MLAILLKKTKWLLVACCMSSVLAFAHDAQMGCGADCTCGCAMGYPCHCGDHSSNQVINNEMEYIEDSYTNADNYTEEDYRYYVEFMNSPWYTAGGSWEYPLCCGQTGVWFAEQPALFKPLMADPRQICYSVGWRFDDQVLHKNVIDVSFGDSLSLYEWTNFQIGSWCGRLRVEVEGALWACFSPCQESAPLLNADYYGGIPITFACDGWAFRLRAFHISSHIGDEFLLSHPRFKRLNPSAEYLDFFASHDFTNDIRIYGGIGWIVRQDETFHCSPFYAAAGAEVRLQSMGNIDWCNMLYGVPIFGMHFRFSKDYKRHVDATYVLGYEWGKLTGLGRKVRAYLEYHDGYSTEGQFCQRPTNYLSFRTSYSY
ncbi:MAG: DUF1207 domain-containing protein [Parachlamydiaceae bacterium]|nr:DUF1207 domain-containing protein [Parachlamydiaceae bacterium]